MARVAFTFLSVMSLGKLIEKVSDDHAARLLALVFAVFGGGLGFLVWQNFGMSFATDSSPLKSLLVGQLPIDVWQPEAFFFSSALTNGLFMVSLWLILGIFHSILDVREKKAKVLSGAFCFAGLMNIHSYDVLLIGLVWSGLFRRWRFEKS